MLLTGTVESLPGQPGINYFFMRDGSGGIEIYSNKKLFPNLALGDTVRLMDLLVEAEDRAARIVEEKNAGFPPAEKAAIAHVVGIGAVKYADLCNDRIKDYVFDWDRMMAMDGNTAPYLQYAYARIQSIFRKAGIEDRRAYLIDATLRLETPEERVLALRLLGLEPVIRAVGDDLEPHQLCRYLFELAAAFSAFFNACPVLSAQSTELRISRLLLCEVTARTLKLGLGLLGIEVLERM